MTPARLLLLCLALAGAAGGLWFLVQAPAPEPTPGLTMPAPVEGALFTLDPSQLDRLTVHRPRFNETLRIEKGADGNWRLTEPVLDWCEPAVLGTALQALYERDWTPAPPEWSSQSEADLGLAPAQLAVEARTRDGVTQTLRLGAGDHAGRWLAAERDGERIRVGPGVLSRLGREIAEWRDHRLQPFPPPAVRRLRWSGADGSILELEREGEGWRIVAPIQATMDHRRTPFVERLLGARAVAIQRDALQLRPLQEEPLGTLVLETVADACTWTIYPGQLTASHRDYPLVWAPDDLSILLHPAEDLRSRRVLELPAGAIVALRIEMGDVAAVFRRGAAGWNLDGSERALSVEENGLLDGLVREGARLEGEEWSARPSAPATGRVIYSISRTPRPQPGRVLEWWTDAEGRVTAAAADVDRATVSAVNFDLAVRDLLRRAGVLAPQ